MTERAQSARRPDDGDTREETPSSPVARLASAHSFELLQDGERFFRAAFAAIRNAKKSVYLETFIVMWDDVGRELLKALETASANGARVHVTVDGYGTAGLPGLFTDSMKRHGIDFRYFDPSPKLFGLRTRFVGRLHRKLLVIDEEIAFVGGINFTEEQLVTAGPEAKRDFAVAVRGPIAADILEYIRASLDNGRGFAMRDRWASRLRRAIGSEEERHFRDVEFVTRDNREHTNDIERRYLLQLRRAEREIVIANAYFFPSWRFLRHLRHAVERGVSVTLILQGKPDKEYTRIAAGTLYDYLLDAGVRIQEYEARPYHGKVAVFDGVWSTIGSSNLDPLSFALNLEANLFIRDEVFAQDLQEKLGAMLDDCREITRNDVPHQTGARHLVRVAAFHVARHFPRWLDNSPFWRQRLESGAG